MKHGIDNIKFDDETGRFHIGSMLNLHTVEKLMKQYPKPSEENINGVIELEKKNQVWRIRDIVVTNKLNGVSNGIKVNDKILLGSWGYDGFLICPYNDTIRFNKVS